MTTIGNALLGTLSIFAFNLLLAVAFVGLGLALRRVFGLVRATLDDCFLAFWMGFGIVILFLMLWNFVLPVGPASLVTVLVAGIASLAASRRMAATALRESRPDAWAMAGAVLFGLWVANLSLEQMRTWDTSLYHMQGVKWARNYPVLPGLANVFGPMGFNNASFLYNAMLDAGPWSGRSWHVSNGVLVSALGAQIILSAGRLLRGAAPASPIHLFSLLLLPAAVSSALAGRVSSFATVVPASLMLMVIANRGHQACSDTARPDADRAHDFFCMVALAAIAVSIKTSAAVFAAGILALACYALLRLDRSGGPWRGRALLWSFVAVAVIGAAWVSRGVILSGYPLFPSQAMAMPVDWRVPAEHARAEFDFVVHSALGTASDLAFVSGRTTGISAWLPYWIRAAVDDLYKIVAPAGLAATGALLFFWSRRRATPAERAAVRPAWLMLPPLVLALVAWFAIAPMSHYGAPFLWSAAALIGSQAFRLKPRSATLTRWIFAAGCLLGVSPCFVTPLWNSLLSPNAKGGFAGILEANVKLPDPGQWYQSGEPEPQLTTYTTETGLVLNVPTGSYGRCWDAPLPCTPNPAPNLRLRVPGRIERGFTVDGEWQMLDWPEPWRPDLLPALREGWRRRAESAPR